MKELATSLIFICCTCVAHAQLKVNTTGNVIADKSITSPEINSVKITSNRFTTDTIPGFRSYYIAPSAQERAMGMYAVTFGGKRAIGMYGMGQCFTSSDMSIGVLGSATSSKCAGIYGTSYGTDFGTNINGIYAGFFHGNVKITGTVNAYTMLLPSSKSFGISEKCSAGINDLSFSDLLNTLELNTYFLSGGSEYSAEVDRIQVKDGITADAMLLDSLRTNTANSSTIPSDMERQMLTKKHYGLDAEQLKNIFPDLVYENEDGSESINYVEMVPILVQAINELKDKIKSLEGSAIKPETRSTGDRQDGTSSLIFLGENKPNPFTNSTTIPLDVPEEVQRAFIYVYDLTGKKLQQLGINTRGKQNITLDASTLTDGMYLYSLIADGKVVQTRRMIVEK